MIIKIKNSQIGKYEKFPLTDVFSAISKNNYDPYNNTVFINGICYAIDTLKIAWGSISFKELSTEVNESLLPEKPKKDGVYTLVNTIKDGISTMEWKLEK